MRIRTCTDGRCTLGRNGATLVEILIGVGVLGLMASALFGGMSLTLTQTRIAREDLRATQVMLERMEGIRLFNWNQLLYSNDLCPATFTSTFDPTTNGAGSGGIIYYGSVVITNVVLDPAPSYSTNLRAITVSVDWTNFGNAHHRSMTTFQAQYGMQNYIFNN